MDIEKFRIYCLSKKHVSESFPFDEQTLVFKVGTKVFAITGLDSAEFTVNLKCDPERSVELRDEYPQEIIAGFHMNKKHWNTVAFEVGLPTKLLQELIDHSYQLVIMGMTKKERITLNFE